jgi:DNA polymerase-3 subunit alpha
MSDFVHLHNHTHYSLLDAMATPMDLLSAAKDDNQPAIALTDHGVMFGCLEFTKNAKKVGVKPIIGMEAYVANGSRFDRSTKTKDGRKRKNYYHLVMLAKNEAGYKNLLKLTTLGHTEGFYYKPRIDRELVEKYSEGIVVSSACIGGIVNNHLVNGDFEAAMEEAAFYKKVFGEDFYLEIQNHFQPADKIILELQTTFIT